MFYSFVQRNIQLSIFPARAGWDAPDNKRDFFPVNQSARSFLRSICCLQSPAARRFFTHVRTRSSHSLSTGSPRPLAALLSFILSAAALPLAGNLFRQRSGRRRTQPETNNFTALVRERASERVGPSRASVRVPVRLVGEESYINCSSSAGSLSSFQSEAQKADRSAILNPPAVCLLSQY